MLALVRCERCQVTADAAKTRSIDFESEEWEQGPRFFCRECLETLELYCPLHDTPKVRLESGTVVDVLEECAGGLLHGVCPACAREQAQAMSPAERAALEVITESVAPAFFGLLAQMLIEGALPGDELLICGIILYAALCGRTPKELVTMFTRAAA